MATRRLVVIEDDRTTREALQGTFIRRGWEVAMVMTRAEGSALLQDYAPHWVVMSSDLPDGPCDSLVRRLRSAKPKTRVAIVTESSGPTRLAELASLKPHLLLQRPLDSESVYDMCVGRAVAMA